MELKSRTLKFTHDGEPYEMRFPNVGELEEFTEKDAEDKSETGLATVIEFVEKLGLKRALPGHWKQTI